MTGLFVTGMQRSGTTLLDKLLHAHPQVSLLSQPFPLLFVDAKRAFLENLGAVEQYPLAPLFLESRYRPADFTRFLARFFWNAERLAGLFAKMEGFAGQYHRWDETLLAEHLPSLDGADLATVVTRLCQAAAPAEICGIKETTCEEFLPYFLERGYGLLLLRDPRDVLASLNGGRGEAFAGKRKPTLFNLRQWRKSVAFALALEGHPRFLALRYEDLVTRPQEQLDRIAQVLGIVSEFDADLPDWAGNSSHVVHRGIGTGSVGTYSARLSPEVIAFVEAACHPEMHLLGYEISLRPEDAPAVLRSFEDPWVGERPELAGCDTPASREQEVRRLELLAEPEGDPQPWFLFPEVHAALRAAR
jgi:hypothetical protein